MKNDIRSAYVPRDAIVKLLSDAEIARVCTAETMSGLADGDEYVDLERLDQGVQRASAATMPMGGVLAKGSVHEDTWSKILVQLASVRRPTTPSGA
jgi:hypothetical protein